MKRIYIPKKETKPNVHVVAIGILTFLGGCFLTATTILNLKVPPIDDDPSQRKNHYHSILEASSISCNSKSSSTTSDGQRDLTAAASSQQQQPPGGELQQQQRPLNVGTVLLDTRILVVIAAFDFSQIPHLEEVLDSYHDVCVAGAAAVDVVIHATVAYPVTLIDLWNSRFSCPQFSLQIDLKPKSLRLYLVDCHRALFYEKLHDYDLFIYTEDDIQVTPTTVATYLYETKRLEQLLEETSKKDQNKYKYIPSDFNVGIVRYEYNYPPNVIIDDKTRHATQNVTRVYWEHSGFKRPVVPNCVVSPEVKGKTPNKKKSDNNKNNMNDEKLLDRYVSMKNHHQGMFLATRQLLAAWKDRKNCNFDQARNRPGRGSQPTEGTQRVWMSSQMLYGGRHCGVTQILPKDKFGALTVWHLPNKNYRRVGKYRNRTFSDGTEVFDQPTSWLLTAMELHLGMRQAWPAPPQHPYRGIQMTDSVNVQKDRSPLLERRMTEFQQYVDRGGVLSELDMTRTELLDES